MQDFFDRSEVFGVLQGFNPWWVGRELNIPSFQRLAYQVCRRHLADAELRRALLLSGPRRVGKTTILWQLAASLLRDGGSPQSVCYLSLDHPLLKLLSLPKILAIYHQNVQPEGQPTYLLLDEVQYSSEWDLQLKQLVDHHPEYRIVATGSASVVQRDRLAESGVGRWLDVPVPTLSFYEFLHIRGDDIPPIPAALRPTDLFGQSQADLSRLGVLFRPLMPLFLRYLLVGGFPETARQRDTALCQRLLREDVVERVLKRDMTALFGIRNVSDLEKLFIYICLKSGGILAVQTCAKELGVSATTVSNHLTSLEQANLIYRLPPAEVGGKAALKGRAKIYLVDAALRNAVLLRGEEIQHHPEEMGIIVETTVLRHLYAYYYRDRPQVVYYRDPKSEREVDIIVRSPAYVLPVEVKYRETAHLGEKDGLVTYCRQTPGVRWAYFVTRQEEDFGVSTFPGLETQILKVPAHVFTYLLGQAERLLWTA